MAPSAGKGARRSPPGAPTRAACLSHVELVAFGEVTPLLANKRPAPVSHFSRTVAGMDGGIASYAEAIFFHL